jgi:hypothetical protein
MKKMTIALSAAAGLAAATVAMASPAAAVQSAPGSAGDTTFKQQCIVIDLAAAGTTHEAARDPAKQVVPTFCP